MSILGSSLAALALIVFLRWAFKDGHPGYAVIFAATVVAFILALSFPV